MERSKPMMQTWVFTEGCKVLCEKGLRMQSPRQGRGDVCSGARTQPDGALLVHGTYNTLLHLPTLCGRMNLAGMISHVQLTLCWSCVCRRRTHERSRGVLQDNQREVLGRKGNTGKGFGVQGESPQKVKPTGVSSSAVQGTERVQSLSSPDWRKICTSMRTSDWKTPRNPSRWELRGRLHVSWGRANGPHRSHKTVEGARLQSTGGVWAGQQAVPMAGGAH